MTYDYNQKITNIEQESVKAKSLLDSQIEALKYDLIANIEVSGYSTYVIILKKCKHQQHFPDPLGLSFF